MKTLLLLSIFFFNSLGNTQMHQLKITITGLKNSNGQVMVGIYQGEQHFLKKIYFGKVVSINNKEAMVVFENLPTGEYAISLYHDENNNGKLDMSWLGIPKEDYGCSNGAKGIMGPPSYQDAKFTLSANKTITIKI